MRKKILAFASAFVLAPAVLFAGAAPVAAHGIATAHTSCAGGVVGVIDAGVLPGFVSGPGRGPSGAVVKFLATDESAPFDVRGAVLAAHEGFCE